MANPQLHPLEVNARTGEPFLRLNHHQNIILTPHRPSDAVCYPPILNDPRVHEWLMSPPIPYLSGNLLSLPFPSYADKGSDCRTR